MRNGKMLLISAFAVSLSANIAIANCLGIPDSLKSEDGNWLFQAPNGSWKHISELNLTVSDGRSRDVSFVYVARTFDSEREGIIVVKTGVRVTDAQDANAVKLARQFSQRCNDNRLFLGGKVKAKSYDSYHDYSYNADKDDQNTLESFHLSYPVRTGACKRSNDDTPDSYMAFRWQSNRSQFSFDKSVVDGGQFSQFFAQFGPTPAFANTLSDRRVEIKHYTTRDSKAACVAFNAAVKPGAFVRVVDLERRTGLLRAPEQSWEWPTR